eukprot:411017-Amphidinium_carterae.1
MSIGWQSFKELTLQQLRGKDGASETGHQDLVLKDTQTFAATPSGNVLLIIAIVIMLISKRMWPLPLSICMGRGFVQPALQPGCIFANATVDWRFLWCFAAKQSNHSLTT